MSKHTVLITSALYTNYGIYSAKERIQQTIATAQSVHRYLPGATIYLVDNSKVDIQSDTSDEFEQLLDLVDHYIDNSDDLDIQHFHNNVKNYDIGKNSMEVIGTLKALQHIAYDSELKSALDESSRIFKLSGRYELTNSFDITQFDNENTKDKYVFKTAQASWCDQEVTGVDHLLQTRLWSFTPHLLELTITTFGQILANMFDTYNKQQYIDVEHSMYKFINQDRLVQLDTVGLKGHIAPNGMIVIE